MSVREPRCRSVCLTAALTELKISCGGTTPPRACIHKTKKWSESDARRMSASEAHDRQISVLAQLLTHFRPSRLLACGNEGVERRTGTRKGAAQRSMSDTARKGRWAGGEASIALNAKSPTKVPSVIPWPCTSRKQRAETRQHTEIGLASTMHKHTALAYL